MTRRHHMLFVLFVILTPLSGMASPVGNIGDPLVWDYGPLQLKGGPPLVLSVFYDTQTNRLPEQVTRFIWADPTSVPLQDRHFQQTRSSRTELTVMGIKLGVPFGDRVLVYGLAGSLEASIDFHYGDWTVWRSFEIDAHFESDPDVFYGIGTSLILERFTYRDTLFTLGLDLSYRRYTIEQDRLAEAGLSYASTLDEIQLGFNLSADMNGFSPYLGVKVASITGTEDYIDRNGWTDYSGEGYIHYNQDIEWSKNVGYVMGVTTAIKGWFTLGLEARGGDENALGFNATTRF
jgi:hypothetical protein